MAPHPDPDPDPYPPPTPTVVRYLRRLDRRALAALVADVYGEMGREVTVEDGLVVTTGPGVRRVVLAVTDRRGDGTPVPDRDVSVVVTTGDGSGRSGAVADALGADLRTAEDVVEMLFYAVDRDVTDRLCDRHLGRPPAKMNPPPTRRLRNRAATIAGATSPPAVAGVVAATAVVVLVLSLAAPSVLAPPSGTASTTPTAGTPVPERADGPPARPPGIGPNGSVDVTRIAIAHHRVLRTNEFRLERSYSGPAIRRGSVVGNYTSQYRLVEVGSRTRFARWRTVRCDGPGTARERYFDGSGLYEARYNGTGLTVGPLPRGDNAIYPRAAETSASVVERYLDASNVTVRPTGGSPTGRYTLIARGRPDDLLVPPATNYTARAAVDPSGLVEDLRVSFDPENGSHPVRTSLSHSLLVFGEPEIPPWYRDLPDATLANVTVRADGRAAVGVPFAEQIDTVTRRRAAHCRDGAPANQSRTSALDHPVSGTTATSPPPA
jgi:hypothetical protein